MPVASLLVTVREVVYATALEFLLVTVLKFLLVVITVPDLIKNYSTAAVELEWLVYLGVSCTLES